MAIHRILIEGNQNIELVTETENRGIAGAKREENVAAANDRLVRIIGVQVQPSAHEDPRQDIAGRGDSLTGRAANCDREIDFCHYEPPLVTGTQFTSFKLNCPPGPFPES